MMNFLGRHEAQIYALMRIVVGFLFACHGGQKLLGILSGAESQMGALIYPTAAIELLGGTLILFGLFTRWAAFICSGMMAVAYFGVHQPQALLPLLNRGEPAALYSFVFLFIAARGAGTWGLDRSRSS